MVNLDLKAKLRFKSKSKWTSIYHLIQIWIRLKKLYFHGKWHSHFTHKSVSAFIICRNLSQWKNKFIFYIFNEKFPNQCKEQTNRKVPFSTILPLHKASFWIWWLCLCEKQISRLSNLYNSLQSYVCFTRLENLVYQNNPFIIIYNSTIGQSST